MILQVKVRIDISQRQNDPKSALTPKLGDYKFTDHITFAHFVRP